MNPTGGTEDRNPASSQLSEMTALQIITLMTSEEMRALEAVQAATRELAEAAEMVADVYSKGGRVFFLGSGTSARLAAMEAAELPPTFGIDEKRFVVFAAAGPSIGPAAVASSEDDVFAAGEALKNSGCRQGDAVFGIAASGSTPFVLFGMQVARSLGAWTCGIANNPDTAILDVADLAILLDTGPEILTGSTRLKAGTAQKLALNRVTTAALVRCGLVRSNLMVNVKPNNSKLQQRSIRITAALTSTDESTARMLLENHGWNIIRAIDSRNTHDDNSW
jgi:N-acetylmuramic acid 6-phosphate etherase